MWAGERFTFQTPHHTHTRPLPITLLPPICFLLLSFSVLLLCRHAAARDCFSSCSEHASSAAGELGVREHAASVKGIAVLRDVCDLDVVLCLTETLSDLRVHFMHGAALRGLIECLSLVLVTVLLALPHVGDLLGGHSEH